MVNSLVSSVLILDLKVPKVLDDLLFADRLCQRVGKATAHRGKNETVKYEGCLINKVQNNIIL